MRTRAASGTSSCPQRRFAPRRFLGARQARARERRHRAHRKAGLERDANGYGEGGDGEGGGDGGGGDSAEGTTPTPGTHFAATSTAWTLPVGAPGSYGFDEIANSYWSTMDLDGDGKPDLVVTNGASESNRRWLLYKNTP